ncbi:MAG: hypothetical protein SO314_05135, partial [Alphaproteobacteria bacterium]|nr:hypothetical protein [Alphaproteobacteria bacterium]
MLDIGIFLWYSTCIVIAGLRSGNPSCNRHQLVSLWILGSSPRMTKKKEFLLTILGTMRVI